jgi:hypothetical protein
MWGRLDSLVIALSELAVELEGNLKERVVSARRRADAAVARSRRVPNSTSASKGCWRGPPPIVIVCRTCSTELPEAAFTGRQVRKYKADANNVRKLASYFVVTCTSVHFGRTWSHMTS